MEVESRMVFVRGWGRELLFSGYRNRVSVRVLEIGRASV